MFAGEGDAKEPRRNITQNGELLGGEIWKALVVQHEIRADLAQAGSRIGSRDGHLSPLFGHGNILNVELGPQNLMVKLEMAHDSRFIGGCCCHEEMMLRQP